MSCTVPLSIGNRCCLKTNRRQGDMNDFECVKSEKLRRQLEFIITCDELKQIFRRTVLTDASRRENDAEHSWHLALCAMVLEEYAPVPLDMQKVLRLVTVHDLIEIYAGDTFAYDTAGNATKALREAVAAEKLFSVLGRQGDEFRSLWEEFEAKQTPEAQYAAAMDRLQPMLHNYVTDGYTWKEGDVHLPQVLTRMEPIRDAVPAVWEAVQAVLNDSVQKGILKE